MASSSGGGASVNIHIFKEPWDEMQAEIEAVQGKATMFALRATGRTFIKGRAAQLLHTAARTPAQSPAT